MSDLYRPCVLAVIVNQDNKILVGERADKPGVWQMPQGGVDAGETDEQALFRELAEEIGTSEAEVIKKLDDRISYDFPKDLPSDIIKRYKGQKQAWFLVSLKPTAKLILLRVLESLLTYVGKMQKIFLMVSFIGNKMLIKKVFRN